MDDLSNNLSGLDQVIAKLDTLTPKETQQIFRAGVRAGANIFANAMRAEAPVAKAVPGKGSTALPVGFLKSDITVSSSTTKPGEVSATVRPGKLSLPVAKWVEDGHRIVKGGYSRINRKTGKKRGPGRELGQTVANEFAQRAFSASAESAIEATERAIVDGMKAKGALD